VIFLNYCKDTEKSKKTVAIVVENICFVYALQTEEATKGIACVCAAWAEAGRGGLCAVLEKSMKSTHGMSR